ncbi:uncharacterized protein LOC117287774 [Asterias rubens]|uniref:Luqin-type n=1 Tax=Asterias rubens TaxID=7604 RepID=A0A0U2PG45_ASTRU|nr:uncharacterized protein LOC117287774 [Asterias rubens]ALJ99961.1 luqin-type precursor [Asterias rubens]
MTNRTAQEQCTRAGSICPSIIRFSAWLLLTILVAQVLLGTTAKAEEKTRFPKFMRWGKRYSPDYVVMDDNELKDEMKLPVFGNGEVLCKNVASGGLYRCGKVPATA